MNIMYIDRRLAIHVDDEATNFCSAPFLCTQSTKEIWKAVQEIGPLVYLGPLDYLVLNYVCAYTSKEMR